MGSYRVLVTGPRDWADTAGVWSALNKIAEDHNSLTVVHGACPTGVDRRVDEWARPDRVPHIIERYPAQNFGSWPWCGPARNAFMVELGADVCLAFYQPCSSRKCKRTDEHGSHGTDHCARTAKRAGIPVEWVGR